MRKHVFARIILVVTLGFLLLFSGCFVIINEEAEPKACKGLQDEAMAQHRPARPVGSTREAPTEVEPVEAPSQEKTK